MPEVGSNRLLPQQEDLSRFVEALFRYADEGTFVTLRAFRDDADGTWRADTWPVQKLNGSGLTPLIDAAAAYIERCANVRESVVFAPPLATFSRGDKATNDFLANGLALSVECDERAGAARRKLEELLGPATAVVASGGEWIDPATGEVEDKLHLHWRLTEPTRSMTDHVRLRDARAMACQLVSGDATSKAIVHPMRWPGSWHRKKTPRLARLVSLTETEIDLGEAIDRLKEAISAAGQRTPDEAGKASSDPQADPLDVAAALAVIPNGNLEWDDWNRIGMATWRATGGRGFAAFDAWSQQSGKYDAPHTRQRWDHYSTSPPTAIGAGTLFHEAARARPGWRKPSSLRSRSVGEEEPLERNILEAPKPSGDPVPPLAIIYPARYQGLAVPERRWIVPDWIKRRTVTGLYGDGGTGKSLLLQMLQTASWLSRPWIGLNAERVKSFSLYCEDDADELHIRQAAINALYGCEMDDLEDAVAWTSRPTEDNVLLRFTRDGAPELTPLWHQVREQALDQGAELIGIDTAADTFGGESENHRGQVRQYVQMALGRLATQIDGAVVVCAHPSRAGLISGRGDGGSTGWSNSFRSRVYLYRPEESEAEPDLDARILELKKTNAARIGQQIPLRWSEGVFVVDGERAATGGVVGSIEADLAERVFLDLLDDAVAKGIALSSAIQAANYAPKMFTSHDRGTRRGLGKDQLAAAMRRLIMNGMIGVGQVGKTSSRHPKQGLVRLK